MKTNKYNVYITIFISIASFLLAVLFHTLRNDVYYFTFSKVHFDVESSFFVDLFFGIFSGSLLTFIISLNQYYISRRMTFEEFYDESIHLISMFRKIIYFRVDEPEQWLIEYFSEESSNKMYDQMNKQMILSEIDNITLFPIKHTKRNVVYIEMRGNLLGSGIIGTCVSQIIEENFRAKIDKYNDELVEAMKKYVDFQNVSIKGVENAWAKMDFICGNKYKRMLYRSIYEEFSRKKRSILQQAIDFKIYFESENGNRAVMAQKVFELQRSFFAVEKNEQKNFENVYRVFASEMDQRIEYFRAKMYKQKPEIFEKEFFSGYSIKS